MHGSFIQVLLLQVLPETPGTIQLGVTFEPTIAFAIWHMLSMIHMADALPTSCVYQQVAQQCCAVDRYSGLLLSDKALLLEVAAIAPREAVSTKCTQLMMSTADSREAVRPLLLTVESMVRESALMQALRMVEKAAELTAADPACLQTVATSSAEVVKNTTGWRNTAYDNEMVLVKQKELEMQAVQGQQSLSLPAQRSAQYEGLLRQLRATLVIIKLLTVVMEVKVDSWWTNMSTKALVHALKLQQSQMAAAFQEMDTCTDSQTQTDTPTATAAAETEEAQLLCVLLSQQLLLLIKATGQP